MKSRKNQLPLALVWRTQVSRLGNQTVLLRGINDCTYVMKKLMHGLVKMRVRPYYIYQCDLSMGIEHFRTPVSKGIEIIEV